MAAPRTAWWQLLSTTLGDESDQDSPSPSPSPRNLAPTMAAQTVGLADGAAAWRRSAQPPRLELSRGGPRWARPQSFRDAAIRLVASGQRRGRDRRPDRRQIAAIDCGAGGAGGPIRGHPSESRHRSIAAGGARSRSQPPSLAAAPARRVGPDPATIAEALRNAATAARASAPLPSHRETHRGRWRWREESADSVRVERAVDATVASLRGDERVRLRDLPAYAHAS